MQKGEEVRRRDDNRHTDRYMVCEAICTFYIEQIDKSYYLQLRLLAWTDQGIVGGKTLEIY